MKVLGTIIGTIALMLFASETTTFEGFLVQIGAGVVLVILILIWRRYCENNL